MLNMNTRILGDERSGRGDLVPYTLNMRMNTDVAVCGLAALATLLVPTVGWAQNGDRAGEVQREMPEDWQVPTVPPLSPEEALERFTVAPGYRVELVAAEPLVHDPVQIAFDADGSIWVVEMRGYMPNADGENEHEPTGRVVRLRDTDGDGRMDVSEVFMDHLILPRAIAPAMGGVLMVEPPNLKLCRDLDGDGEADDIQTLVAGFAGLENPEHAGNGLRYGIDNWYETSQHHQAFKLDGDKLETRSVRGHGQWGVARDDLGRLYYSPNSDPLITDAYPKHYSARNAVSNGLPGVPKRIAHDKRTWPVRMTPGVNRGYQKRTLRSDGTLQYFTAACGPEIFRSNELGEDLYGDAFICETAGNLVKRYRLEDVDGEMKASQAYEEREFLASTDERFRPVNLMTGPDGALYVADFYRGIVQHRIYMTTWLRKQVDERGLDQPVGMGRIWRVVREDVAPVPIPDLSTMTGTELVGLIALSDNGTVRDTAQRLLVERKDHGVANLLRDLVADQDLDNHRRLQALWILDGIGDADSSIVEIAAEDGDPVVREHAARVSEGLPTQAAASLLAKLAQDDHHRVRMQAVLSIGELPSSEAMGMFEAVLEEHVDSDDLRRAVQSGLGGREVAFLRSRGSARSGGWLSRNGAAQREVFRELASLVLKRKNTHECTGLLALASSRSESQPWQSMIILDEVADSTKATSKRPKPLKLVGQPAAWSSIRGHDNTRIGHRARLVDTVVAWPGRTDLPSQEDQLRTPEEILTRGRRLYAHCMGCHQPNGRGLPPVYPPLDESPFVTESPERLARILLHGLQGKIEVAGQTYNQAMPAAPFKNDADIAAVMTYIRQAWDNNADPVDAAMVTRIRKDSQNRNQPWTPGELEALED